MNRSLIFLIIVGLLVSGCATLPQQAAETETDTPVPATATPPPTATPVPPTDTPTVVPPTDTPAPPTRTPEPTWTMKPTSMRKPVESADEILSIWSNRVTAGSLDYLYLVLYQDGSFQYSSKSSTVESSPAVTGEFWFEDDLLHIRDKSNTLLDKYWPACDASITGIYWVTMISPAKINLKPKTDPCSCTFPKECRRLTLGGDWERIEE